MSTFFFFFSFFCQNIVLLGTCDLFVGGGLVTKQPRLYAWQSTRPTTLPSSSLPNLHGSPWLPWSHNYTKVGSALILMVSAFQTFQGQGVVKMNQGLTNDPLSHLLPYFSGHCSTLITNSTGGRLFTLSLETLSTFLRLLLSQRGLRPD